MAYSHGAQEKRHTALADRFCLLTMQRRAMVTVPAPCFGNQANGRIKLIA